MLVRSTRTLVALFATLALLVTLAAMPAAAQLEEPECVLTENGTETDEVADDVTLTFDADFVCADAADTGAWTVLVLVTNDSDADVTIEEVVLSHATPGFNEEGNQVLTTADLPLALAAGATGSFEAGGTFALSWAGLVNLHLRAVGTATDADEEQRFTLGINVHVLGPEVDLEDPEDGEDGGEGGAGEGEGEGEGEGRPEWVQGPPPWVIEMMRARFGEEFPPGFWKVVNRNAADEDEPEEPIEDAEGTSEDDHDDERGGPPSWAPGPPPWAGGGNSAEERGGPPGGHPGGRP